MLAFRPVHFKKLIAFVDGTNFLSGLSREMGIPIIPDKADALYFNFNIIC